MNAQLTRSVGSYTLRGQDTGANAFTAVDGVKDIIERQIRRFKTNIYRSGQVRKGVKEQPVIHTSVDLTGEEAIEGMGQLVRTKRFAMEPMSVEDAILQVEMLDHSFFLFLNMDSFENNVAYRRQDEDYGLIEPELT